LNYEAMRNDELRQIAFLERENARLQQLVAELLIKNEQLRQLCVASPQLPPVSEDQFESKLH
jgi:hypothetical protein